MEPPSHVPTVRSGKAFVALVTLVVALVVRRPMLTPPIPCANSIMYER